MAKIPTQSVDNPAFARGPSARAIQPVPRQQGFNVGEALQTVGKGLEDVAQVVQRKERALNSGELTPEAEVAVSTAKRQIDKFVYDLGNTKDGAPVTPLNQHIPKFESSLASLIDNVAAQYGQGAAQDLRNYAVPRYVTVRNNRDRLGAGVQLASLTTDSEVERTGFVSNQTTLTPADVVAKAVDHKGRIEARRNERGYDPEQLVKIADREGNSTIGAGVRALIQKGDVTGAREILSLGSEKGAVSEEHVSRLENYIDREELKIAQQKDRALGAEVLSDADSNGNTIDPSGPYDGVTITNKLSGVSDVSLQRAGITPATTQGDAIATSLDGVLDGILPDGIKSSESLTLTSHVASAKTKAEEVLKKGGDPSKLLAAIKRAEDALQKVDTLDNTVDVAFAELQQAGTRNEENGSVTYNTESVRQVLAKSDYNTQEVIDNLYDRAGASLRKELVKATVTIDSSIPLPSGALDVLNGAHSQDPAARRAAYDLLDEMRVASQGEAISESERKQLILGKVGDVTTPTRLLFTLDLDRSTSSQQRKKFRGVDPLKLVESFASIYRFTNYTTKTMNDAGVKGADFDVILAEGSQVTEEAVKVGSEGMSASLLTNVLQGVRFYKTNGESVVTDRERRVKSLLATDRIFIESVLLLAEEATSGQTIDFGVAKDALRQSKASAAQDMFVAMPQIPDGRYFLTRGDESMSDPQSMLYIPQDSPFRGGDGKFNDAALSDFAKKMPNADDLDSNLYYDLQRPVVSDNPGQSNVVYFEAHQRDSNGRVSRIGTDSYMKVTVNEDNTVTVETDVPSTELPEEFGHLSAALHMSPEGRPYRYRPEMGEAYMQDKDPTGFRLAMYEEAAYTMYPEGTPFMIRTAIENLAAQDGWKGVASPGETA